MDYQKRLYEFIIATKNSDCSYNVDVFHVYGTDVHSALIEYCKDGGLKSFYLHAICSVSTDDAIQIANEQLVDKIVEIHERGVPLYKDDKFNFVKINNE